MLKTRMSKPRAEPYSRAVEVSDAWAKAVDADVMGAAPVGNGAMRYTAGNDASAPQHQSSARARLLALSAVHGRGSAAQPEIWANAARPTLQDLARAGLHAKNLPLTAQRPTSANPLSSLVVGGGGSLSAPGVQVCKDFLHGTCTRGEECRFNHSVEAVRVGAGMQPCKYFQVGACTRGEDCKFTHELLDENLGPEVCKDFLYGVCTRGDECKFSHSEEAVRDGAGTESCRYFMIGACVRGETCKFSHDVLDSAGPGPERCRYFIVGACNRGEDCKFSHTYDGGGPISGREMCKDFIHGQCTRGEACIFSHNPEDAAVVLASHIAPPPRSWADDLGPGDFCRNFQYGACARGDDCKFLHRLSSGSLLPSPAGARSPQQQQQRRGGISNPPSLLMGGGGGGGALEVILAKVEQLEDAQGRVVEQLEDMKVILNRLVDSIGG